MKHLSNHFVIRAVMVVALIGGLISPTIAQEDYGIGNDEPIPRRVYWGDTHLHTSFSPDANVTGNVKLGPTEAYEFARGKTITAHNGMKARLDRPLDFLVVSDHGEYLGF